MFAPDRLSLANLILTLLPAEQRLEGPAGGLEIENSGVAFAVTGWGGQMPQGAPRIFGGRYWVEKDNLAGRRQIKRSVQELALGSLKNTMDTKLTQTKSYLQVSDDFFTPSWEPSEREVVMVILRSSGKLLLLTKEWYPKGIFRLPSGRIKPGETVQEALKRELKEETGLELQIIKPLGIITCEIHAPSRQVAVTSYIFLLDGKSKELNPQDKKERIAAFKEIEIEELKTVAENLNSLKGKLRDWGKFRAIAHQFVYEQLTRIRFVSPSQVFSLTRQTGEPTDWRADRLRESRQDGMQRIFQAIYQISKACKCQAYLVGGSVRDLILHRPITDFDIAVSADSIQFGRNLAKSLKGSFVLLDEETKTVRIVLKKEQKIDLVPLRTDIISDVKLRDFTIDAIAIELTDKGIEGYEKRLVDPLNGLSDLRNRKIKMAYPNTFIDDPLRMLRALRLAAQFEFEIDKETENKIAQSAPLIEKVASERIRDELFQILVSPNSFPYILQSDRLGLLSFIIPEINLMRGVEQNECHHLDVWQHSLECLRQLEVLISQASEYPLPTALFSQVQGHLNQLVSFSRPRYSLLKFIALVHDVGKPACKSLDEDGSLRFIGHDKLGAEMGETIGRRLKLTVKEIEIVKKVIKGHLRPGFLANLREPSKRAIYRFFRDLGDEGIDTLILSFADRLASLGPAVDKSDIKAHHQIVLRMISHYFQEKKKLPIRRWLNGHEIMARYNLPPGPLIGKILSALEEAQATGEVKTKPQAWEFVDNLMREL